MKPGVRVKFPWHLSVGPFSWIGEDCWIDNLAPVTIGSHCCLSQSTYLCTGSHDHTSVDFRLVTGRIVVHDGVWICAKATLLCGVVVGRDALVMAGALVSKDVPPAMIVGGVPARVIGVRV